MTTLLAQAVEEREEPRLGVGSRPIDVVDRHDVLPDEDVELASSRARRSRDEHRRPAARFHRCDGGTEQMRLAGPGRAPQHHAGLADLASRERLDHGERLGIAAGQKVAERRRFRRGEIEDELFGHGVAGVARAGIRGRRRFESGKIGQRRTLPRRRCRTQALPARG